jgi:peptidyl-prolyl cis-trans isomerase SurA
MKGLKKSGMIMMIASTLTLATTAKVVDRIVAVVNKTVITELQVQQAQQQFQQDGAPEAALKRDVVVDFLVKQELVLQEAQSKGIVVTDEELNNAVENIKQRNKLASDEELKQALASQGMIWTKFLSESGDDLDRISQRHSPANPSGQNCRTGGPGKGGRGRCRN